MSKRLPIDVPAEELREFCARHHIIRLSLFGSVLREDFRPDSDVDLLVEFAADHTPGLAFFAMQEELSDLLGRPVDLNTHAWLSRHFRDHVLRDAEILYDAA